VKAALGILSTLFVVASPFVLYWTLTNHDVAVAALTLIGWVILRTIPVLLAATPQQRRAGLQLPAIALGFALLGWLLDDGMWLLVLPSATQATFGLTFLRSLRGTPLIEHFARMVKPELSAGERDHCRRWTKVWGLYLLVLAAIGWVLAVVASLAWWTLYVGVLNYVLVGLLFAVEYVVRKISFRDYGRSPVDWVLGKLFPRIGPGVS
jgi:uncharacterized membrane protein